MVEIAFNKQYGKDIKKLTEDENFHLEDLLRRIKYNRLTPGDGEEFWMSYNGKRVYSYRVNNDVRLALFKHKEKQYEAYLEEEKALELRQFSEIGVQRFFIQHREQEEEDEIERIVRETELEME